MGTSSRLINADALGVTVFVDRCCDQAIIMRGKLC